MSTESKARKPKLKVPESEAIKAKEETPPLFNLTFKNAQGTSIVSIPEGQVHHMAQAIHHFFRERNIQSTLNFKANAEQDKLPAEGS